MISPYRSQLISDQSSIGSHAQYLPQAMFAQIAPLMIITPYRIRPNSMKLAVEAGSAECSGSLASVPSSDRSLSLPKRYTSAKEAAKRKATAPTVANDA